MLNIEYTTQFKRDLKRARKRKYDLNLLNEVMKKIAAEQLVERKSRDHLLTGNWQHHRELHLRPDWLLIYKLLPAQKTVIFVRTGTHAELFK